MTYGWAILIIAVVLGALFELGLFNFANLAPKSPPGSCQVLRPNGPGTTSYINLEGVCNNGLPQYVAQFNGQGSVSIGTTGLPSGSNARSVFAWVYYNGIVSTQEYSVFGYGTWQGGDEEAVLSIGSGSPGTLWLDCYGCSFKSVGTVPGNGWHFIGYTYASGASFPTFYIDGISTALASGTGALNTVVASAAIGQYAGCGCNLFVGKINNVQVYNTSLSANEITALYDEGIGGVPLNLNSLVGWWPLNGNANDYSGNLNNGVSTNVVYTSSWTSGYSAP